MVQYEFLNVANDDIHSFWYWAPSLAASPPFIARGQYADSGHSRERSAFSIEMLHSQYSLLYEKVALEPGRSGGVERGRGGYVLQFRHALYSHQHLHWRSYNLPHIDGHSPLNICRIRLDCLIEMDVSRGLSHLSSYADIRVRTSRGNSIASQHRLDHAQTAGKPDRDSARGVIE